MLSWTVDRHVIQSSFNSHTGSDSLTPVLLESLTQFQIITFFNRRIINQSTNSFFCLCPVPFSPVLHELKLPRVKQLNPLKSHHMTYNHITQRKQVRARHKHPKEILVQTICPLFPSKRRPPSNRSTLCLRRKWVQGHGHLT
jgi:hypothetical protein